MNTLTVLCPVYNEEPVIAAFHAELARALDALAARYAARMLFVVDRGTDRTLAILRELARRDERVSVLALSARFGHQKSLLAGIDHCDSDVLIMMDSDGQHPPALIPRMLEKYEEGFDIVRTERQDPRSIGFFKRLSSRLFYRFLGWVSEVEIHPNSADFRLLSRRVVRVFQRDIRERTLFLRGLFGWVGFNATSLSFKTRARGAGRSKYSLGQLFSFAAEGVVSFSRKPLRWATGLGVLFAASGFLMAVVTAVQYYYYGDLPSGWATLAVLIPTFSGIQLIFMGVIGEYIGAIFDEVKARPHYIVEERVNLPEESHERTAGSRR